MSSWTWSASRSAAGEAPDPRPLPHPWHPSSSPWLDSTGPSTAAPEDDAAAGRGRLGELRSGPLFRSLAVERRRITSSIGEPDAADDGQLGTGRHARRIQPIVASADHPIHDALVAEGKSENLEGRARAQFRYWLHGDGVDEPLESEHPLSEGDELETSLGWAVVGHIGPPAPDGYRPVSVRVPHPGHD